MWKNEALGGLQMVKQVFKWISNGLAILLVVVCALSLYSIVQAKSNPGHIPSILGNKVMIVSTGSMEPMLKPGDLIVVKSVDPLNVQENDVISFENSNHTVVTHRVMDVSTEEKTIAFETKGDANNVMDDGVVQSDQLVGSLLFSIPKAGYVLNFFKSPTGVAILLVLPLLYISIGVFHRFFNNQKKQDKDIAA